MYSFGKLYAASGHTHVILTISPNLVFCRRNLLHFIPAIQYIMHWQRADLTRTRNQHRPQSTGYRRRRKYRGIREVKRRKGSQWEEQEASLMPIQNTAHSTARICSAATNPEPQWKGEHTKPCKDSVEAPEVDQSRCPAEAKEMQKQISRKHDQLCMLRERP